ncbi:MAG TPA: hypothetical protein VLM85_31065 [Polyangiaceae bacterium]|nr:hypothetical protein [Polyangiaceae bacterium]
MRRALVLLGVLAACSRPPAEAGGVPSSSVAVAPAVVPSAAPPPVGMPPPPDAGRDEHAEQAVALPRDPSCRSDLRCLVEHAYASDPEARATALALLDETGDVAGTDHEQTMDGGFRGTLHLLPELPTGASRAQLAWVLSAARDFDAFFAQLAPASELSGYRWRGLTLRFFRSMSGPASHEVQRTTPSAYAMGPRPAARGAGDEISYSLGYNVKGSLLGSETGVRETLFHEVFHMNDAAHRDWSRRVLGADYAAILKRCGATKSPPEVAHVGCLRPYAPNDTMVRGGTFYAFQPNNGESVREYAAELALRWYKEHRALWRKQPRPAAFKCGPPENARAWDALVKEFFGGIDRIPPCP